MRLGLLFCSVWISVLVLAIYLLEASGYFLSLLALSRACRRFASSRSAHFRYQCFQSWLLPVGDHIWCYLPVECWSTFFSLTYMDFLGDGTRGNWTLSVALIFLILLCIDRGSYNSQLHRSSLWSFWIFKFHSINFVDLSTALCWISDLCLELDVGCDLMSLGCLYVWPAVCSEDRLALLLLWRGLSMLGIREALEVNDIFESYLT